MKRSLTQQTVAGMAWMIYGKVAFAILRPAPAVEPAAAVTVE